jgi:hypothetical protein
MSEIENAPAESAPEPEAVEQTPAAETPAEETPPEEITYHAVERDGQVTAIWEMQGRKHLRTIDPRSRQGQEILRLYTADHHDETPAEESGEAASS